jgi:tetratricopeptide (TPR) repeat protein
MDGNTLSCSRRTGLGRVLACLVLIGVFIAQGWAKDAPAASEAVRFEAVDVAGKALTVPDAGRTTVLLFLLAGQAQGGQAVAALRETVGEAADVRVVAVVGGAEAAGQVRSMVAEKCPWPIVLDVDHALSGRLSVHAWPTTVIVSPQGVQVAHVAGLPKAYASNVEAYLARAAGRIDRAGLERRLANHEAVLDSSEQMAERHVQVASRLLQKGLVEQSRAELGRAVAMRPTDAGVQAELVDLLLRAGDAKGAAAVLEQMDRNVATARVKVLRGKLLIASGKWDEARALLTAAVQLNPDPAEGLYQLGLVYQHDGDWPRAAEACRRACEHAPGGRGEGVGK